MFSLYENHLSLVIKLAVGNSLVLIVRVSFQLTYIDAIFF